MLQGLPLNDESEEPCGTSNDSPSAHNLQSSNVNEEQYWAEYRVNWINQNQELLDNDYEQWVQSNIDYNVHNQIQGGITDHQTFKQSYPVDQFYEMQYQQFLQVQFGQQEVQDEQVD